MKKIILLAAFLAIMSKIYAISDIQIVGGNSAGNPKIAVVSFDGDNSEESSSLTKIITNDLGITGEFDVTIYPDITSVESNALYIITGAITSSNTVNYKLSRPNKTNLLDQDVSFKTDIRKAAHTISNNIYQNITNTKGIFTTKIAYILQNGQNYQVIVSDYDGYNPQVIFSTNHPVTSLAWDSQGRLLSYVSFESGKPVVYVQDLFKASRYVVANFEGSNSSPEFTPDGKALAVTLTKDYGSHIYLINNMANNQANTKLISFGSIDTEASFANNGNMVFTSNHDGGPQIFMSSLSGSAPTRLTLNLGHYNTTARFSHDASKITFINRNAGVLKAYVMELATKSAYPISLRTNLDLAPSFSPNDKLVLFSSNGNSVYIGNSKGTIQTRLNKISGIGTIIDQRWANNY